MSGSEEVTREEKTKKSSLGVVINLAIHGANKYVENLAAIFGDDVKPYWSWPDEKDKEKVFHASLILNERTVYLEDDDAGFNVGPLANTDPDVKIAARLSVCVPDAVSV